MSTYKLRVYAHKTLLKLAFKIMPPEYPINDEIERKFAYIQKRMQEMSAPKIFVKGE